MQKISPFLWFDKNAEQAVDFYVSVFPEAKKTRVTYYGEGAPGATPGQVMTVEFELFGQDFVALNGGPHFKFDEAISFVVNCETQEEIDRYWDALLADGGEESQCGWLRDRFGLSWQITPTMLLRKYQSEEAADGSRPMTAGSQRMFEAMMGMVKLDIAALERAYRGES